MTIKNPFRSLFTSPGEGNVLIPILNDSGLLVCIQRPSGSFESREVKVPESWSQVGRSWYLNRPINLVVEQSKLLLSLATPTGGSTIVDESSHVGTSVVLYEGVETECHALLVAVRQAWFDANQMPHVGGWVGAGQAPTKSVRRLNWSRVALVAGVFALVAVGAGGMHLYLRQPGPGLDLSSMSIDQVAALDANPVAVRQLQDQLMAAMKAGQEDAKKMTGQIEKNHLDALTAMGLQPGISAKNAISCLASASR